MPIDNKNMSGHSGAPVPGCILGIESLYSQKSANTAPDDYSYDFTIRDANNRQRATHTYEIEILKQKTIWTES